MTVSVKVYFGDGNVREIRRFDFRPETAFLHQTSAPPHHAKSSKHQQHAAPLGSNGVYQNLVEQIRLLYNGLNLHGLSLCWKDDDGDYVAFSSDDELRVAINNTRDNTLRIYIREREGTDRQLPTRRSQRREDRDSSAPCAHCSLPERAVGWRGGGRLTDDDAPCSSSGAAADNHVDGGRCCVECSAVQSDVWFKCTVCPHFYICQECEVRGLHNHHIMYRLTAENINAM